MFRKNSCFLLNECLKEEVIETKHLVNIESDSNEEKAIIEIKAQINSCPKDTPLIGEKKNSFLWKINYLLRNPMTTHSIYN